MFIRHLTEVGRSQAVHSLLTESGGAQVFQQTAKGLQTLMPQVGETECTL